MKAFVTGGTGFIGQHLVRKLVERGYQVTALTPSEAGAARLTALGAQPVFGDILDQNSMRQSMKGSDVVFHLAGWYHLGGRDWMRAESINVAGARNVLRLATELGIPRIIYTSTTAVFGDTRGRVVDESFFQGGPFATEYDRTKWLAHYKVALPLIEQGAPITIVMPGGVYGPGDHSLVGQLMEHFYWGRLPAIPGPDFGFTYAHVEDIAEGHILAAEKGRPGETYILTGPAIPLGELIDFWGQLTGKRPPALKIPASLIRPFVPLLDFLGNRFDLPPLLSGDGARILNMTYMGRSDKARAKLGWRTRSLQEGMTETFRWIAGTPPPPALVTDRERKAIGFSLLGVAAILSLVIFSRWRK